MIQSIDRATLLDLATSVSDSRRARVKNAIDGADAPVAITVGRIGADGIDNGTLRFSAWSELPEAWPDDAQFVFFNAAVPSDKLYLLPGYGNEPVPTQTIDPPKLSRTMMAVQLIRDLEISPYAAAKRVGINPSAVSRALGRRRGKQICPHCKQVLRKGFTLDD